MSRTRTTVEIPSQRKALRAIFALVVLAAIVVGVPFGLAEWGHWPISGVPTLKDIQDGWTSAVSDTAVFGLVTVAAWGLWVLFLVSVVVEARAELAERRAGQVPLAGPVQRSARYLVVSLLLWISSLSAGSGKGGESLPDEFAVESLAPGGVAVGGLDEQLIAERPPVAVPAPGSIIEPGGRPHSPSQPSGSPNTPGSSEAPRGGDDQAAPQPRLPERVTVQQNDTAWGIAEHLWGDGLRWTELWEVNKGRTQPDGRCWEDPELIHPGWELEVPGAEQVPAPYTDTDTDTDAGDPTAPGAPEVPQPETHTVVPGDTLWDIAGEHLGDPTAYPEIFERNQGAQIDGRTFDDPDLIHPGWVLEVADGAGGASGEGGVPEVPQPPDPHAGGTATDGDYEVEPQVAISVSVEDLHPGGGGPDEPDQSATPYASGGHLYLVGDGVVRYVDSTTFTEISSIAVPGRVVATIDSDGILWAVTPRDGMLRQIVNGEVVAETQVVDPGHDVAMTLSGNRPVLLDVTADELWFIDRRSATATDGPLSAPGAAELQGSSMDGTRVWMIDGERLLGLRPDGDRIEVQLDGRPDGPPDVSSDQVELLLDDGTELTFADEDGELLTERQPDS